MKQNHKKIFKIICTILIAALITGLTYYIFSNGDARNETVHLSYNEFVAKVEDGEVKKVEYMDGVPTIKGTLKDGTVFETKKPLDEFGKVLMKNDVEVIFKNKEDVQTRQKFILNFISSIITFAFTILIIKLVAETLIKKQTKSMDAHFRVVNDTKLTFDDVAGNEEAKKDLMELVEFIKNPVKYTRYGAEIPKGTLLSGPPGNGKTLMAQALAGTANVSFIPVSGSDFVQQFVGVGAARTRELFKLADENSPCIIFIDEIDALGKRSNDGDGASDEKDRTLNQLLVEMDGFTSNSEVLVIAATNRPGLLDPALLRPGRFDRQISIELPDVDARHEILKIHTRNKPLAKEIDLRQVAEMTTYMSGADLKNIMNEASIYAARAGHKGILMKDIDRAINKVVAGEEKANRGTISRLEKEITAYHEAGHALMAKLLTDKSVPKVTIIPTTKGVGGYTMITPEEKMFETKQEMLDEIAILLGGRVAEEIIFGRENITGGAGQDLKAVTQIVERMVKNYGMSESVGLISIDELYNGSYDSFTNELIIKEIKDITEKAYKESLEYLNTNKAILHSIAQTLLEKETIYEIDLDKIIEGNVESKLKEDVEDKVKRVPLQGNVSAGLLTTKQTK